MTEREKMIKGMLYDASDEELTKLRAFSRQCVIDFNRTNEDETDKRLRILDSLLGGHGEDIYMEPDIRFDYGFNTYVGDNFFANFNCTILDVNEVRIGDNVFLGPNVSLYTPLHSLVADERAVRIREDGSKYDLEYSRPITIGDNVWIGGSVVVAAGVTIGCNSVIGAGSVVTRDIPSGVLAAGVPCRVIREITDEDRVEK